MRRLVHLSDLHFGRIDALTLQPLRAAVRALRPHLVVVSGDLTQRARPEQFRQARRFLASLGRPFLATPGNHDIPLWNPVARFTRPLVAYRRHFAADVEPLFVDDEIAVIGASTARRFAAKSGRIRPLQVERIRARLEALPDAIAKIVVTHHPLALPDAGVASGERAEDAEGALAAFAAAGVDVLLAGHLHRSLAFVGPARGGSDAGLVAVSAGTATSDRRRAEANGFNVVGIARRRMCCARWRFDGRRFRAFGPPRTFERDEGGWRAVEERAADERTVAAAR